MKNINLIGINHIESSTEEIEEFTARKPKNILKSLVGIENIDGIVEVNTCLRREIYFGYEGKIDDKVIKEKFGEKSYYKSGSETVSHPMSLS